MSDFPEVLSAVVDNVTDAMAKYINNLEIRLGIKNSAVPDTIDYLMKANPRGFLMNGKIVPSVASDDLTVAIKGMDGNDPSVANPVYCRIGDTVRSITSALSVTCANGTNWFNAGGDELATNENDYFVYLGYNATDGVTIGISRIPYANEYDDFSTTSTEYDYCAISNISNAVAGDDYEVVGRFAATLSATADFLWTVPTFTNKNLIQRPIYRTRWLNYSPVFSAATTMTYTSVTVEPAKYCIDYDNCSINLRCYGTTGGTATAFLIATLPIPSVDYFHGYAEVTDKSGQVGFFQGGYVSISAFKADKTVFGLGENRRIRTIFTFSLR